MEVEYEVMKYGNVCGFKKSEFTTMIGGKKRFEPDYNMGMGNVYLDAGLIISVIVLLILTIGMACVPLSEVLNTWKVSLKSKYEYFKKCCNYK